MKVSDRNYDVSLISTMTHTIERSCCDCHNKTNHLQFCFWCDSSPTHLTFLPGSFPHKIKSHLQHKLCKYLIKQLHLPTETETSVLSAKLLIKTTYHIENNCTKMNLSPLATSTLLLLLDAAPTLVSATK